MLKMVICEFVDGKFTMLNHDNFVIAVSVEITHCHGTN